MSHGPLDPSTDPLLSRLGQLGVPAGGAPSATAAMLLSKAAVAAPVVAGLAGIKLYGLLGATLAVGLGGGVVITELVRGIGARTAEPMAMIEQEAADETMQSVEQSEDLAGEMETPAAVEGTTDGAEADGIVCASAESAPPKVVYVTRYVEVPVVTDDAAEGDPFGPGGPGDSEGDDDWIGEPDDDYASAQPTDPPTREDTERVPNQDPTDNATASAEVVPTSRRTEGDNQLAEGHLRIGLDGGAAAFPDGALGNLSGAVGLELLGPGPAPAAPLLAVNLDAGLMSEQPLGTLAFDGEAGIALRPSPELRISIAGVGGVRFVDQGYWDTYMDELSDLTPEDERLIYELLPTEALTVPTFGGRLGLVIGDRRRSPLSFRMSFTGQALVFREPLRDTTTLLPRLGGTVGVDVQLPPAGN